MTSEVWYRPAGTRRPIGAPSIYHLWYRARPDGSPETTVNGATNWRQTAPSREFQTMDEIRQSGLFIRVMKVGDTTPFDPDFEVDEGL